MKMQTNKIDKQIADKLKDREFKPSLSAWERLSEELNKEPVKKKHSWVLYLGYAASIVVLIGAGFLYILNNKLTPQNIIVNATTDTLKLKEVNLKEIIPVEEAIVKVIERKEKYKNIKTKKIQFKEESKRTVANVSKQRIGKILVNHKVKKEDKDSTIANSKKGKSSILVNSDDLLFVVTHSQEEVKEYYAKYKINRKDVLDTIRKELIKSNLAINPETILAEVEYDIKETDFEQNFMKKFKSKLSNVIVAIADRNK
ncbi:hypothetical protein [Tenacibaculum soleae]|uniref:hypothetical protein n=1 Tax=Tenacibaculum soleae TaxID=447689 RepID=UPI0026E38BA7|nr:hypothetical protein [Tenacibaculum soleae]MDO6813345.1 hypothetical protein [Tenacibaculum soleae]